MRVLFFDGAERKSGVLNMEKYLNAGEMSRGITLHLLGDSLCCDYAKLGFNPTNAPQTGWGQIVGDYFSDSIIIDNQSRAGWSLKGFLLASNQNYEQDMSILNNPQNSRWKKVVLPTIKSGDYVIVSSAINDKFQKAFDFYYENGDGGEYNKDIDGNYVFAGMGLGRYNFYTWTSTIEEYRENLNILVNDIKSRCAVPILVGSTSVCDDAYEEIVQFIQAMKSVAYKNKVEYLDVYGTYKSFIESNGGYDKVAYMNHFTPENIDEFRKSGIAVGTKWDKTTKDTTHYNMNGAKCVAQMIIDLLRKSGSDLKSYIK